MNNNKIKSLVMVPLIMANFIVNASEEYSPAEYKPKVDYSEYTGGSVPIADLDVNEKSKAALTIAQKSVVNTVQATTNTVDKAEINAVNVPKSEDNTIIQTETAIQPNLILIVVVVSMLGGFVVFRRKSTNTTTATSRSAIAVLDLENASTGVERYIEKIAVSKTGVDKYLERQVESMPSTGVANYLAKQVVRNNLKN
jgi:hypothetical protein